MRGFLLRNPFKFSFLGQTSSGVDGSSFTFSGQSLGPFRYDRNILVCVSSRSSGTPVLSSSCSIAGVAATVIAQVNTGSNLAGIIGARVPAGATGDIVIDFSGVSSLRCGIAVYSKLGGGLSAFATGTSTAANPTATLTVPSYGVALGVATTAANSSFTTAGLTENADSPIGGESTTMVMGSTQPGEIVGSSTFTFTPGSSVSPVGAFAVWGNS